MTNRNAQQPTSNQEEAVMTSGIALNGEQFASLKHHRTANISPSMSVNEFARIKKDIAINGMQEAIVLCNDKIIDGRSRHQAAIELIEEGVLSIGNISIRNMPSDIAPLDFILSMNMHRKHYNESQRALCAARMLPIFEREATKNQKAGKKVDANKQQGRCNEIVGKMVNVSARSVATAKKLQDSSCANLISLVETGVIRLSVASQLLAFFDNNMSGLESALKATEKDIKAKVNNAFAKRLKGVSKAITEVAKELDIEAEDGEAQVAAFRSGKKLSKEQKKVARERMMLQRKLKALHQKEQNLIQAVLQTTIDCRQQNFSQIIKSKCSAEQECALTLVMEFGNGKFTPSFKCLPAATASTQGIVMETFSSKEDAADHMESHASELAGVKSALVPFSESLNILAVQLLTLKPITPLEFTEMEEVKIKENPLAQAS